MEEVAVLVSGRGRGHITINTLPDEVLLEIFDFCVDPDILIWTWETLVHVCRRWRSIVFASPHRLDLRLFTTAETPTKEMLDIWPTTLPINLRVHSLHDLNEDNVIATLEHKDRICEIRVRSFDKDSFQRVVASMQVPFPALTHLSLANYRFTSPPLPESFVGGSAPGLRFLSLYRVAVLGLPKLLLSATRLNFLCLDHVPHSGPGYMSPYVMADCLSSLTRLEHLRITFTPEPYPDQTSLRPPPPTRTILPKLTYIFFEVTSEHLEVLFSWIDTPIHKDIHITFFNPVNFGISQLSLFIGREDLITEEFHQASMRFNDDLLEVILLSRKGATGGTELKLSVKCGHSAWQLQSLSHWWLSSGLYYPSLGFTDCTEYASGRSPPWTRDMEKARWLEFLHFFAAVENLYPSEGLVRCIAPTLRDLAASLREGGAVTVLPALKCLFVRLIQPSLSGRLLDTIGEFIVAREFAGHPVVFDDGERKEGSR